jgi:hypothetical protein
MIEPSDYEKCPNCNSESSGLYISCTGVVHCGCYWERGEGAIYVVDTEENKLTKGEVK